MNKFFKNRKMNYKYLIEYPHSFHSFLNSLKSVDCEINFLKLEIEIFTGFYMQYKKYINTSDYLLNTKIQMYRQFIKPIHLYLEVQNNKEVVLDDKSSVSIIYFDIDEYIPFFTNIFKCVSPTEVVKEYILLIKDIYKSIQYTHDTLLSVIVYLVLKSGISDFKILHSYINKYRRRTLYKCKHSPKIKDGEMDYYWNLLEIAICFIEKMEYNDLNMSREEYDRLIASSFSTSDLR